MCGGFLAQHLGFLHLCPLRQQVRVRERHRHQATHGPCQSVVVQCPVHDLAPLWDLAAAATASAGRQAKWGLLAVMVLAQVPQGLVAQVKAEGAMAGLKAAHPLAPPPQHCCLYTMKALALDWVGNARRDWVG